MANTFKKKWLKLVTRIAEESSNPKIQLEAIRLGLLIQADNKKPEDITPDLTNLLNIKD